MAAKHLVIAKTEGVEAGFDAFMAAPSSRLSPNYKAIMRKRSEDTRLKAYCDLFGDKIATVRVPKPRDEDKIEALEQAIAMLVGKFGPEVEEVVNVRGEMIVETIPAITLLTSEDFITADVAWDALGRGTKRPNDGAAPATNGQLWRLNTEGRLTLS